MNRDLRQLLENQQAEAHYSDSATFTLDSLRARETLSKYQLPHSGLWLVKFVQAAVALEARQVRIRFESRRVWLHFEPARPLCAEAVLHEVLAGTLPGQDAMLHLVTGIRACAATLSETIEWRSGGSRVQLGPKKTVNELCSEAGFTFIASRPARRRGLRATLTSPLSHLARQTVEEYEALANRCWACPIPIEVDGKPLQTGYGSPLARGLQTQLMEITLRADNSRRSEVSACLGLRHLGPLPGRPLLPVIRAGIGLQVATPLYSGGTFLTFPGLASVGAVLCVEHYHGSPSQVDFVWDGAVVASQPLDWSDEQLSILGRSVKSHADLGVRCVFATSRQELDVSQFALQNEADLAARLSLQVLPEVVELLDQISRHVPQLSYLPYSHEHRGYWGTALGVTLAGMSVLAASPLPFLCVGLVTGINRVAVRRALWASLERLTRVLQERQASGEGHGDLAH